MTDKMRLEAARRFRELLDQGVLRKAAIMQVISEIRLRKLPCSRTRLYAWCGRFGISTK